MHVVLMHWNSHSRESLNGFLFCWTVDQESKKNGSAFLNPFGIWIAIQSDSPRPWCQVGYRFHFSTSPKCSSKLVGFGFFFLFWHLSPYIIITVGSCMLLITFTTLECECSSRSTKFSNIIMSSLLGHPPFTSSLGILLFKSNWYSLSSLRLIQCKKVDHVYFLKLVVCPCAITN